MFVFIFTFDKRKSVYFYKQKYELAIFFVDIHLFASRIHKSLAKLVIEYWILFWRCGPIKQQINHYVRIFARKIK